MDTQQILNLLKKSIDRIVLILLILIGCVLGFIILNEDPNPTVEEPKGAPYEVVPKLTKESENYIEVTQYFNAKSEIDDVVDENGEKKYEYITVFNPFERVRFLEQEQIDKLVSRKIQNARMFKETGQYEDAIQTCLEILKMDDRPEAKEIIKFCRNKLKARGQRN